MLYHHCDGYPDAMLPKLEYSVQKAMQTLDDHGYGVDAEKFAAILVAGSVRTDDVPAFYPCRGTHGDIEYRYDVFVDGEGGEIRASDRHGHAVGIVEIAGGDA